MSQSKSDRLLRFLINCSSPTRIDKLISEHLKTQTPFSRTTISNWIASSLVTLDGELVEKPAYKVEGEGYVEIDLSNWEPEPLKAEPDSSVSLNIIWEDSSVLVLNKPSGMVVHPGAGVYSKTLVNGLLAHFGEGFCQEMGEYERPGIIHRLDKDTSGLMVVAKTLTAHKVLSAQFHPDSKIAKRTYLALVRNLPEENEEAGSIEEPIGRDPKNRLKMAVIKNGRHAKTNWKIKEYLNGAYLLELDLETGRTHQIRVHLSHKNAHILGDPLYGEATMGLPPKIRSVAKSLKRQMLHAWKLSFFHPLNEKPLVFESSLEEDMHSALESLR